MLREGLGVRLAANDVAENAQAGDSRDIADHHGELEVHLDQRWTSVAALCTKVSRCRR